MTVCVTGKVPYVSRRHLKRYLRSRGLQKNRVYFCNCGYWHHTSSNHKEAAWFRENT